MKALFLAVIFTIFISMPVIRATSLKHPASRPLEQAIKIINFDIARISIKGKGLSGKDRQILFLYNIILPQVYDLIAVLNKIEDNL